MTGRLLCLLLALLTVPARAADTPLGRLFFTPAERSALEEARRNNVRAEVQAAEASGRPKPPPVRNVSVTGVIERSDGETTVWVNGKPVDGATEDGLKVRVTRGGQAAVIVHEPEKGRTLRLKVGQRANIDTGRIRESYESRTEAAVQAESSPAPNDNATTQTRPLPSARSKASGSAAGDEDGEPKDEDAKDTGG